MTKMEKGECRCTVKGMQYCLTDEGVRFTGKCARPPPKTQPKEETNTPEE